jgi:hypothetical protein
MSKWKRTLIALGLLAIVGGVYLWLFGVQTMCALSVRYAYRKLPDVAKVPIPLSELSISDVRHRTASYFGYQFELPWDDTDERNDKTVGTIHVSCFRSGNAFWFSTFPPRDFVDQLIKMSKLDRQGFRQLYGDEAFESDYAFQQTMLQLTPSEITPFVSRRQAVAGEMLLLIKAISMPRAGSGIFSIETPDFKGFQFENPQARPSRITDNLYSNDGGIELIFIQKVAGGAPAISQSEINRVIRSIRKAPVRAVASHESEHK